ncbi:hypothetical protein BT69DRAFT_204518 [Atractiella rhizophila]|nr:hypothetical protein BT69DRAFT_204518 [Atractiella rhizophila]
MAYVKEMGRKICGIGILFSHNIVRFCSYWHLADCFHRFHDFEDGIDRVTGERARYYRTYFRFGLLSSAARAGTFLRSTFQQRTVLALKALSDMRHWFCIT